MNYILKKLLLLLGCTLTFMAMGYAQTPNLEFKNGSYTYRQIGIDSVMLVACDKSKSGDVVLTGNVSYNSRSFKLISIGDYAFKDCEDVARVTLPNTLTSIGYRAFYGCRNMSAITLSNALAEIGVEAFNYCTGLIKVYIPASVKQIGDGAFWHNWALKSITVDLVNADYGDVNGILFSKNWTRLIAYPAGKTDGTYTLPASTTTIGTGAFCSCKDLVSIVLPKNLVEIRRYAFQECTRLNTILIPKSVDVLEAGTFSGCSELNSVQFPQSMKRIGNRAFENCTDLVNITIPDGVESIGDNSFAGCTELKSVSFPRTIKSIGMEAFAKCGKLNSIHLFGTVPPSVDANAFPTELHQKATLYVKYYAIDAYSHADDWLNFQFIYKERSTFRPYGINY